MLYLCYFSLSFILCFSITPFVRYIAGQKGWVAQPRKDRWHKKPTALMGGIAIYIAISLPLFFLCLTTSGSVYPVAWSGITLLFILGVLDDFIRLKPQSKLIGQILVASMVTFFNFRFHWFNSLTIDTIITIVWIVGVTNALNLIDNMDGLCAGVGFISGFCLSLLYMGNFPEPLILALILAGATLAFLFFNFNPASIFMGDCGSLIIGFTLSFLTLIYPAHAKNINPISMYAVPLLILLVPIFDTTLVTLIRLLSGRKASQGGRDHTSHRLVLMGFSEKKAVSFLYGITLISGVSSVFVSKSDSLTSPAVIIPVFLSIILMGVYLSQIRVYPEKEFSVLRDKSYTPILIELTYKRQLLLVILDFCIISFAYYLSYRLRFDSNAFPFYFKVFLRSLPAIIACKFIAFFVIGIYRGIWTFLSSNDGFVYLKASFAATVLSVVCVTFIYRFQSFSKGIFLIDFLLTTGFILFSRFSFRFFDETIKRRTLSGDLVLIYGAGRGGEILLREILNNKSLNIKPLGFIDDNTLKVGKSIYGYSVMGTFNDIEAIHKKNNISGILISFHDKDNDRFDKIKLFCKENELFLKCFSVHLEEIDL
ncbi:MAG: glycosyl transferase [Desulfobacterales bacterium]|nr:glycosyl transferase [Desulfobacterales bacterium]MBF0396067.1 glycosyl transferase [Desulfobacterales bacterium]